MGKGVKTEKEFEVFQIKQQGQKNWKISKTAPKIIFIIFQNHPKFEVGVPFPFSLYSLLCICIVQFRGCRRNVSRTHASLFTFSLSLSHGERERDRKCKTFSDQFVDHWYSAVRRRAKRPRSESEEASSIRSVIVSELPESSPNPRRRRRLFLRTPRLRSDGEKASWSVAVPLAKSTLEWISIPESFWRLNRLITFFVLYSLLTSSLIYAFSFYLRLELFYVLEFSYYLLLVYSFRLIISRNWLCYASPSLRFPIIWNYCGYSFIA